MEQPLAFGDYREREPPLDTVDTQATIATRYTRLDLSQLADATKHFAVRTKYDGKRENICAHIGKAWIRYDTLFEQKYCNSESIINAAKLFALVEGEMTEGRWRSMRGDPSHENEVLCGLLSIIGLLKMPPHARGSVIDTHGMRVPDDRGPDYLRPDMLFQGSGPSFPVLAGTADKPSLWSLCTAPADAKRKKSEGSQTKILGQLGTYVEQVFSAQENRRFVPTFHLNQHTFRFLLFDRGGAVSGHAINYHSDPWKLFVLAQKFLLFDDSDMGFDDSIFYQHGYTYIQTSTVPGGNIHSPIQSPPIPATKYVVEKTLFHSTNIRGNGTIYWLVYKGGIEAGDAWYIVKDSWVVGGCAYEREILEKCKDIEGVASLEHIQDVTFRDRLNSQYWLDSVSNNRPHGVRTNPLDDRVHTRAVFRVTAGAKLLDRFSNVKELLEALHDAVEGHRRLYSAGVLHGDISPSRIVMQPDAVKGNRGVLLDLHSAVKRDPPSTRPKGVLGSRAFYSRKSLREGIPSSHSYLDDLESFYYVLCYLVACYPTSGSSKPGLVPSAILPWFSEKGGDGDKARDIESRTYSLPIHQSFGTPVRTLMESLHGFFRDRVAASWDVEQIPDPEKDYSEFLKNISNAIDALGGDPRSASTAPECRCLGVGAATTIGSEDTSNSEAGASFDGGNPHSAGDTALDRPVMPLPPLAKPHTLTVNSPLPRVQPERATQVITVDNHNQNVDSEWGSMQLKDKEGRCSPSMLTPFKRPRLDKSNVTQEDDSDVCYSAT